jgi:hypothetical protein
LRGRRQRQEATVSQDVFIPKDIDLIDPRFYGDDSVIQAVQQMQPENICAVYGLSRSMLGIEAIDQFATFKSRVKVYFNQTLIPQLSGIERAFDRYFNNNMPSAYHGYVRFDLTKVEALADDVVARFTAASAAHLAGLPWSVCNERFSLGMDLSMVPGADTVMVSSTLAPLDKLIAEWDAPDPEPEAQPVPPPPVKTETAPADKQAAMLARAKDSRANVQRGIRLLRAEKAMRGDWRKLVNVARRKTMSEMAGATSTTEVRQAAERGFAGWADKATSLAKRYHEQAAREGQQAIVEIVSGKMLDAELHVWKGVAPWRPEVTQFIANRQKRIEDMSQDLFDDVLAAAEEAVSAGKTGSELMQLISDRFDSGPGGTNRAVTIARTEIGSAYNVARHEEMRGQGYAKHMWITSQDDLVRDGEFNHAKCNEEVVTIGEKFSCGLAYPMEDGGEAGNVINCRCETLPIEPGME